MNSQDITMYDGWIESLQSGSQGQEKEEACEQDVKTTEARHAEDEEKWKTQVTFNIGCTKEALGPLDV